MKTISKISALLFLITAMAVSLPSKSQSFASYDDWYRQCCFAGGWDGCTYSGSCGNTPKIV